MATTADASVQTPEKKSKLPLILGVVMLVGGAGGGFAASYLGMLDPFFPAEEAAYSSGDMPAQTATGSPQNAAVSFVPLPTISLNVGHGADAQILRFAAQLEVPAGRSAEVTHLMPRILDVLNLYLRALDPRELQEPAAILRLRTQMLRRAQIVAGPGAVRDLLVSEFVMN